MSKRYRQLSFPLALLLLLMPVLALAAGPFEPALKDQSMIFLERIFGEVGGVIATGGTSLLKGILLDFNSAVLVLGGIVIIYSMLVSTINTANEGEMLGRQWNSVWIPLRAAGGFALLLPVKANGYSLIQVFVMWVVVQGVGAADTMWSRGVDMIQTGSVTASSSATTSVYTSAQSIFNSKVCELQTAAFIGPPATPQERGEPRTGQRNYGVSTLSPADICGSVQYKELDSDPNADNTLVNEINSAINAMQNSLNAPALDFINAYWSSNGVTAATTYQIQRQIQNAAENYNNAVAAAQSKAKASGGSKYDAALSAAKQEGWIVAGGYFLTLSQVSNEFTADSASGPVTTHPQMDKIQPYLYDNDFTTLADMLKIVNDELANPDIIQMSDPSQMGDLIMSAGLNLIQKEFLKLLQSFQGWLTGSDNTSPLIQIQSFGFWMSHIVMGVYMVLALSVGALTSAVSALKAIPIVGRAFGAIFDGMVAILLFLSPPIVVALGALFMTGLIMAYYIPLIPYIVFTVGAIGWLILVIEAMVAAPLMAIGVLHPEGNHTVFGKAEVGIMLLAGVFLRPALMIIGFFAAIIMSYIVISLVNIGFIPAASLTISSSPVGLMFMIVLYTMLILIVINKAFSLIHVIPDRIMRWIGQQPEAGGAERELEQLRGGAEKAGGGVQQAGKQYGDMAKAKREQGRQETLNKLTSEGESSSSKLSGKK